MHNAQVCVHLTVHITKLELGIYVVKLDFWNHPPN
jgi:hypothetical protein